MALPDALVCCSWRCRAVQMRRHLRPSGWCSSIAQALRAGPVGAPVGPRRDRRRRGHGTAACRARRGAVERRHVRLGHDGRDRDARRWRGMRRARAPNCGQCGHRSIDGADFRVAACAAIAVIAANSLRSFCAGATTTASDTVRYSRAGSPQRVRADRASVDQRASARGHDDDGAARKPHRKLREAPPHPHSPEEP